MKNQELFNKTIAVLVKAYFSGTLAHGDCACCAVGNLVCAGYGDELPKYPYGDSDLHKYRDWGYLLSGRKADNAGLENIRVTSYTSIELLKIENAFESGANNIHWQEYDNHTDKEIQESQYNGLMRVVDTLMQIHECTVEETELAKLQFVKV